MAPSDAQLKSLKEKRANAKRRVTITYNLLEPKVARGVLNDSDKTLHNKLLQEYTLFESAYDNYAEALEQRDDRETNNDYIALGAYLKDVSDKIDDITDKLWFAEAEEKFQHDNENYEISKTAVMITVGRLP